MPNLLNADSSSSSKQELLDLNDGPVSACLDTPSPVESQQDDSPMGSSTGSPGAAGPVGRGNGRALAGQGYGDKTETPYGIKFIPTEAEHLCGWGPLTPQVIQTFNTPQWVLFFLCVASFLQGMIVNGFINTVVTSIERRFDLRSYQTGLIASSYDIAACICLTFVSVLEQAGLCLANATSPCQESSSSLSNYRFVFMLGQFLHGMGATPLYTLGVTYLDENVKSSYAPVYIGIFYTAAIVGPAAGYLLGGMFLNMYTEIHLTTELTPENPLWVGAWWIGFLVGGAAALVTALPILGYPRQLPGSQRYVAMRVSEAHQLKDGSQVTAADPQFGKTVKDMPRSVLLLLKNPTFIFLCFAGATEATLIAGMSTFGPKFLESQFSLSASEAATWFGYMVVPAVAGVNVPYQSPLQFQHPYQDFHNGSQVKENLTVGCNADCHCLREMYNPVCGADGIMYYSPCHAGCSTVNHTLSSTGTQVYSDCSCVIGNNSTWGEAGLAQAGKCSTSCHHMPLFLSFLFVIISFTFLCSIPALTATLRCVPDTQRSFGLGIQWIVVRTLGGIPGPIAFGSVIDISCMLWQEECGEQGSCYLYHNSAMSHYSLIAGLIYKALGTVFFFLASVLYKPPPESPQSSCESTDHGAGDTGDLPVKDVPQEILPTVTARNEWPLV
ncbi:hypothetical protein ANANG_G00224920 [Anguilla anguilla]|uniref:Kazal-like domain-containing protein n=1 Tax=Anguilla anguilla TaxID=7936 RepID=A0A9D3RPQ3_ANGAN|nr:hypothetical protein ANANG_G00224920 [Anguilla anguilla]